METLEALVESIIYQREDNGYTVLEIDTDEGSASAVGVMPFIQAGERVIFTGEWITHPQYGHQFKVAQWEPMAPSDLVALERYLVGGGVPGVGPLTARRIVKQFGMDTLDALVSVDKLCSVQGMTQKRAQEIVEHFHEQNAARASLLFLTKYGVSAASAMRVFQKYGNDTEHLLRENPYRLIWEVEFGFPTADRIARTMGCDPRSEHRLAAGLHFALSQAAGEGHTYLPMDELLDYAEELLLVDREEAENALRGAIINNLLGLDVGRDNEQRVYLMPYLVAEQGVAGRLTALVQEPLSPPQHIGLEDFEQNQGIELGEEQRDAVLSVLHQGVTLISGGPGTGKTTITQALLYIAFHHKWKAALAAPTGRAAKRMTEAAGQDAKTIHRLLEYAPDDTGEMEFQKDEKRPLDIQLLIVDEMSMVDLVLMHHLLKAVPQGTRVVLLGDTDQLPSVGAGSVLRDLVASEAIPVSQLTRIYRQSETSMIVANAHRINAGEMPAVNEKDKDFFFQRAKPVDVLEAVVGLCTLRLPGYYGFQPDAVQVLCPMKKGPAGVNALNKALQQAMNPPSPIKQERKRGDVVFRVGDRVMQIKNNYQLHWVQEVQGKLIDHGDGIYNGDVGELLALDAKEKKALIQFDGDRQVVYDFNQMDELDLAYAISIHKSQGSEFPAVVIPLTSGPPHFMTRNLLYTAVTRAKQLVVLLGNPALMRHMVDNPMTWERHSGLAERLQSVMANGFLHQGRDAE